MLFVGKKGRIGFVDHRNHGRSFEHVRSSGSFRCGRFLAFNFVNRYRVFGKLSCLGAVLLEFVWGKASSLAGDIVFHEHRSPYGPFSFVCFDEASSYDNDSANRRVAPGVWLNLRVGFQKQKRSKPSGSKKWINQTTTLYIGLYIAFLLAGSVVRGIIDTGYSSESVPYLRWVISIGVSGLILAACVWYWFKTKHGIDGNGEAAGSKPLSMAKRMSIGRLTLVCWMVLALLFFSGMFASLIFGSYVEGGHIVVVARSSLDFFLWVLLCDIATKGRIPPVPLFLVCGILTEVASWLVSYVMVPGVLGSSPDEGLLSLETLVLMVLFSLMAFVVVAFGVLALRKQPNSSDKALDSAANSAARVPSERVSEYKLTQREVEVIQLFSQGYSLTKVADELFISKSTAQTHAKSIYRKLDIHSKNELIGKMKEWTNAQ